MVWRKCCHWEARSQPGKHMRSVVRNPISPQLRVYFELRSSKSSCDRTDSCASLAQLGDVHGEQLPFCWRKTTEGQKKLSEEEGAGNLAIMGLMRWKKAQKSEVPHEDKHPPEKCFSRISNTRSWDLQKQNRRKLPENQPFAHHCVILFIDFHKLSLKTR